MSVNRSINLLLLPLILISGCSSGPPVIEHKAIPEGVPHGLFAMREVEWRKLGLQTFTHFRPCRYTDYYQAESGRTYTTYSLIVWTAWNKSCSRQMQEMVDRAPECSHNVQSVTGGLALMPPERGWRIVSSGYWDQRVYGSSAGQMTGGASGEAKFGKRCESEFLDL